MFGYNELKDEKLLDMGIWEYSIDYVHREKEKKRRSGGKNGATSTCIWLWQLYHGFEFASNVVDGRVLLLSVAVRLSNVQHAPAVRGISS